MKALAWSHGVGAGVTAFRPGDRVLISCISACGRCEYYRRGMYSHCTTGGWILGNEIGGTQAEYVRTPHADTSLYHTSLMAAISRTGGAGARSFSRRLEARRFTL